MIRRPTASMLIVFLFLASCADDDDVVLHPKPRGYIRIPFPEKSYQAFESACPFTFEVPRYAHMVPSSGNTPEPCWYNLEFPQFKATVHLSYKQVASNLGEYLEDAHEIANKHQIKATGMEEITVLRDSARVYGLLFDIEGNTASSLQFYLTDSTSHFLRGSLYFNAVPNIDSVQVVVDFIRDDVLHLINTTRWK